MGTLSRPSLSCDAVVLRAWPCGETSVIASLLTREAGFVKVMAKAARRPRSSLRALVEPGRLVHTEFSLDPQRDLQFLRSGSVDFDPVTCGLNLQRTAYLLGALELVDRCRPSFSSDTGTSAGDLFAVCDAFIRVLSSVADADPARLFFAFEWQLLQNHGFDPEIDGCSGCGVDLDPEDDKNTLWFSSADGGVICHDCGRTGGAGRPLSAAALREFLAYQAGVFLDQKHNDMSGALRREVGAHLHRFLGFHLPGYRLPTALDLLRPVRRAEESN